MADIRINALATTAASTASDDFVAVDGSANGTRKLNAYSPTFGGNLTVSGGTLRVQDSTNSYAATITTASAKTVIASSFGGSSVAIRGGGSVSDGILVDSSNNTSLSGNLTVSGGTISSGAGNTLLLQQANYGGGLSANASGQVIVAAYNSQPLRLQTQGADVLYLTSGGNVLVGTTTDGGQKLQVAGAIAATTGAANNALVARYNSSNSLFGVTVNSAGQGVVSENTDASTGSDKYSKTGLPAFRLGNTGGSGTVPFWIDVAASGTSGNAITWTNAFQIDASQNATFAGNIKTAAPSGGTAATWRLGTVASVSPTSPNRTIEVEIGGTTYYIHAKTTND